MWKFHIWTPLTGKWLMSNWSQFILIFTGPLFVLEDHSVHRLLNILAIFASTSSSSSSFARTLLHFFLHRPIIPCNHPSAAVCHHPLLSVHIWQYSQCHSFLSLLHFKTANSYFEQNICCPHFACENCFCIHRRKHTEQSAVSSWPCCAVSHSEMINWEWKQQHLLFSVDACFFGWDSRKWVNTASRSICSSCRCPDRTSQQCIWINIRRMKRMRQQQDNIITSY